VNRSPLPAARPAVRPRTSLPQRFDARWQAALVSVDALCVIAVFSVAGLPASDALCGAAIISGSLLLCGGYRCSYAVRPRDEAYHVAAALTLALLPLAGLLCLISGRPWFAPAAISVACLAALGALRCLFCAIRHPERSPAYAGLNRITPDAQWRAKLSPARTAKRAIDATLAGLSIVVLAPLLAGIAAAIAFDSGLPVLFRQERVGRYGTTFVLFKFRTMRRDAGTRWVKPGDTRITRLGALLRRSSLDELPQFFNVLRGDMSLVGPRPEMCEYAARFASALEDYPLRHIVKPGITGWAQVQLKRNLRPSDAPEVLAYDLFYVEHASPVLDAILLYKTAAEFLLHRAV